MSENVKKVANAKIKKKGFFEQLITEDISDMKGYLIEEFVIPAVQDLLADLTANIFDLAQDIIETAIYGEEKGKGRRKRNAKKGSFTDYARVSYESNKGRRKERKSFSRKDRGVHNFENLLFDSRSEALDVLDNLSELIQTYEIASVADLYQLSNVDSNPTDNNYGWEDLSRASVKHTRDGWIIVLPKPIVI